MFQSHSGRGWHKEGYQVTAGNRKLQIINGKFQNNAINNVKQASRNGLINLTNFMSFCWTSWTVKSKVHK